MNKFQRRFTFSAIGTACFGVTIIGGLNLQAQAITFTKILDLNAPIPGRPGETFNAYRYVSTDGTPVAFVGVGSGGTFGVYTLPIAGGNIVKIADTFTAAPNGGGNFVEFTRPTQVSPFVSNGKVAFYGHMTVSGAAGVYSAAITGGPITKVANYKTTIPGGAVPGCTSTKLDFFQGSPWVSFSLNKIAFGAATCGGGGIYTAFPNGTHKRRIANLATPANYRGSDLFSFPAIDGSHVVYGAGNVFGSTGIFLGPVSATGNPDRILVDVDTPYPDGSGKNIGLFGAPRLWNRSVVFSAARNNGLWDLAGLFLTNLSGADPHLIANTSTTVPGYSGTFSGFTNYTLNGTTPGGARVVFLANAPGLPLAGNGLFQYRSGKLTKIAGDGDAISSDQLCRIEDMSAQSLSGKTLVFSGAPWGGCGTGGIYRANL